jgi:hypothetical protein
VVSSDLTVIDPAQVEAAADPAQYVALACERAKAWLADALEHGGIEEIVELKSQAEAIRIYTQQKQLGKDAELSAAEIVRRAERCIGLAIRRGQEAGEIRTLGQHGKALLDEKRSPAEFFSGGGETSDVYAMTDGVTDQQFDEAVAEGKADGNLSRANVVRRVRAKRDAKEAMDAALTDEPPDVTEEWIPAGNEKSSASAARRRELIRGWGSSGWTSVQIGERLGIADDTVRRIARDEGVTIAADVALGRGTRKGIDSSRIVRETVAGLEGLELALDLVRFDELDLAEIPNWTSSLTASIRVLNRLNKQLKEMVQW